MKMMVWGPTGHWGCWGTLLWEFGFTLWPSEIFILSLARYICFPNKSFLKWIKALQPTPVYHICTYTPPCTFMLTNLQQDRLDSKKWEVKQFSLSFFLLFLLSIPNSTLHLQCQLPHPASSVTLSLNLEGRNSAWGRGQLKYCLSLSPLSYESPCSFWTWWSHRFQSPAGTQGRRGCCSVYPCMSSACIAISQGSSSLLGFVQVIQLARKTGQWLQKHNRWCFCFDLVLFGLLSWRWC